MVSNLVPNMLIKTAKSAIGKQDVVLQTSVGKNHAVWTVSMTMQFQSKKAAADFLEDRNLLKEPGIASSFRRAEKESEQGKARPMEELYRKYGV